MLDPSKLRIAIVGFGSIGRRHFENLASLGVTERIVVRRPASANAAFTPPHDARVAHSDAEAIAAGIDAAVVCNPTRFHVETALRYVAAGVPVLIEKPLCAVGEESAAWQLGDAAKARGVSLGMAYCLRYHPAYRLAHTEIGAGRIGRVLYAKVWFESYLPDWHPWEDHRQSYAARADLGGGALPTLDHEVDFLNWCLGEPTEVIGRTGNSGTVSDEVNDQAVFLARYGEAIATGVLSLCRRDRSRGFEFIGSEGTLRFCMERPCLELVRAGQPPYDLWHGADYDLNLMYREMLADFLMALSSGCQAPVPLGAGLAAAHVSRAVSEGAGSGDPRTAPCRPVQQSCRRQVNQTPPAA